MCFTASLSPGTLYAIAGVLHVAASMIVCPHPSLIEVYTSVFAFANIFLFSCCDVFVLNSILLVSVLLLVFEALPGISALIYRL